MTKEIEITYINLDSLTMQQVTALDLEKRCTFFQFKKFADWNSGSTAREGRLLVSTGILIISWWVFQNHILI